VIDGIEGKKQAVDGQDIDDPDEKRDKGNLQEKLEIPEYLNPSIRW